MEDCAPFGFLRSWGLVTLYLWCRFRIFNRPILDKYVFQVEGDPHLLQSCLRVTRYGLPPTTKEMHLSFESLVVTDTPSFIGIFDGHPP
jgi:hypothetical protein